MISLDEFLQLPTENIAEVVRGRGPKVCVFPINGTRRWFTLEYLQSKDIDIAVAYQQFFTVMAERYVFIFKTLFEHGVDTVLSPLFGGELLGRGDRYVQMAVEGLTWPAVNPIFREFYEQCDVRVRFYGDYQQFFASGTPYEKIPSAFDAVTADTLGHKKQRLFYGLFANDPTETVAKLSVDYYTKYGHIPDRQTIIKLYYGEMIDPVNFFIGFDKFTAFDMPLLATGQEDYYFTVSPSPYFTEKQFRRILYDHLYARPIDEPDDWASMQEFYKINAENTFGLGALHNGIWYPSPQVNLPSDFTGR